MSKQDNIFSIIAPNIKDGGGKVLLEYLLEYLEEKYNNFPVIVYLDPSLSNILETENRKVVFLSSTIDKIKLFTRTIDNALYFGNLPPMKKNKNSMVYFHNPYLLMNKRRILSYSFYFFVKFSLLQFYIARFIHNVDIVACQSRIIKDSFVNKYKFNNVEILPFFRSYKNDFKDYEKEYDFSYISIPTPHKNHKLLFDAMGILSKENIKIKLAVTIDDKKRELLQRINQINSFGVVKIHNLGIINRQQVQSVYNKTKCIIFPSKEESFGLGLVEAFEMGIDVLAPDLDYVHAVIKPSILFNVDDKASCAHAMKEYLNNEYNNKTLIVVENQIDQIINKFTSHN